VKLNLISTHPPAPVIKSALYLITKLTDQELGELKGLVNLIFCDEQLIRELNKKYRQKDKVTDVLSFAYHDSSASSNNSDLLGEIYIDLDQVKRQAPEYNNSFDQELFKLFIHGMLHLRGYDHETDSSFRVMKLLEDKITKMLAESNNS